MYVLKTLLKWLGVTVAIAIASLIGFFIAAWLSPGDPGRSYAIFTASAGAAALLWRWLFEPGEPPQADC